MVVWLLALYGFFLTHAQASVLVARAGTNSVLSAEGSIVNAVVSLLQGNAASSATPFCSIFIHISTVTASTTMTSTPPAVTLTITQTASEFSTSTSTSITATFTTYTAIGDNTRERSLEQMPEMKYERLDQLVKKSSFAAVPQHGIIDSHAHRSAIPAVQLSKTSTFPTLSALQGLASQVISTACSCLDIAPPTTTSTGTTTLAPATLTSMTTTTTTLIASVTTTSVTTTVTAGACAASDNYGLQYNGFGILGGPLTYTPEDIQDPETCCLTCYNTPTCYYYSFDDVNGCAFNIGTDPFDTPTLNCPNGVLQIYGPSAGTEEGLSGCITFYMD